MDCTTAGGAAEMNGGASLAARSIGSGGDGNGEEPARTVKRQRLMWTPQLHKRFVDAVEHLGIKNAMPKTIMQLMSVDGLTRQNVASHLQKYRLYLKRMQGLGNGHGGHTDLDTSVARTSKRLKMLLGRSHIRILRMLLQGKNARTWSGYYSEKSDNEDNRPFKLLAQLAPSVLQAEERTADSLHLSSSNFLMNNLTLADATARRIQLETRGIGP